MTRRMARRGMTTRNMRTTRKTKRKRIQMMARMGRRMRINARMKSFSMLHVCDILRISFDVVFQSSSYLAPPNIGFRA